MKVHGLFYVAVLAVLTGMAMACSSAEARQSCKFNPLLPSLLRASDKEFDRLLMQHGSVKEEEIPCIMEASASWSRQKQMNAARLIVLADGDENVIFAAKKKIISETKHVEIWMYILDIGLELKRPGYDELAKIRPDMITKALEYKNPDSARLEGKIQSTGLRAGVVAGLAGIEEEIRTRLDSDNVDIVEVALDAMPADMATTELPRLTKMLEEYEAGKVYKGERSFVFRSLLAAMIRTENDSAFTLVQKAIEVDLTKYSSISGVRKEFLPFRNKITFIRDDSVERFGMHLIRADGPSRPLGFDVLETRITRKITEPTAEFVAACIEVVSKGELSTEPAERRRIEYDNPSQITCERLFQFLETGEFTGGDRKVGRDAIAVGEKWLKENGGSY